MYEEPGTRYELDGSLGDPVVVASFIACLIVMTGILFSIAYEAQYGFVRPLDSRATGGTADGYWLSLIVAGGTTVCLGWAVWRLVYQEITALVIGTTGPLVAVSLLHRREIPLADIRGLVCHKTLDVRNNYIPEPTAGPSRVTRMDLNYAHGTLKLYGSGADQVVARLLERRPELAVERRWRER